MLLYTHEQRHTSTMHCALHCIALQCTVNVNFTKLFFLLRNPSKNPGNGVWCHSNAKVVLKLWGDEMDIMDVGMEG